MINEFKEYLLTKYSMSTVTTYFNNVKDYFRFMDNSPIKILNATKVDICNYIAYMDGLSPNTIKNRIMAVQCYYRFIHKDIIDDIKVFSQKRLPSYLTLEEAKKLMEFYEGRNRLIIYVFLTTGIRLSELANIRIENIDIENKKITIIAKNHIEREVAITEKCKELLLPYMSGEGKLFNIGTRAISYIVKNAMDALGLKGSVHTLRHTFATIMYEQTGDILLVKNLLGHTSIESTQIYTHVVNERIKNAVDKNPLNQEVWYES